MKRLWIMDGPAGSRERVRVILRHTSAALAVCGLLLAGTVARCAGETCTTQSAMTAADRGAIADAARSVAAMVKANDAAGLRAASDAELAKDFSGLQYLLGTTAPKLADAALSVDQIYLLDATTLKPNADGTPAAAQFFCSLNRSTAEAQFTISALPAGKYAFAIVMSSGSPGAWRLSLLLRQDAASRRWMLAGFYPGATTAAGHDGLWYWTQARAMVTGKQPWNAWLYYRAAEKLLQPANFVDSTHLEKLRTETGSAAPSSLSEGVSVDAPLVIKGADGVEYHFTGLGVDDSLGQPELDVAAHLRVDDVSDAAAARKRNSDAAAALLGAYPELRKAFHGVWIFAEAAGKNPFATEAAMAEIK